MARSLLFANLFYDEARPVGNGDAIGIKDAVGQLRPAEASVNDRHSGKIPGKRGPLPDGRTADEQDGLGRRRLDGVGGGELVDLCLPLLWRGNDCPGRAERGDERQADDPKVRLDGHGERAG